MYPCSRNCSHLSYRSFLCPLILLKGCYIWLGQWSGMKHRGYCKERKNIQKLQKKVQLFLCFQDIPPFLVIPTSHPLPKSTNNQKWLWVSISREDERVFCTCGKARQKPISLRSICFKFSDLIYMQISVFFVYPGKPFPIYLLGSTPAKWLEYT